MSNQSPIHNQEETQAHFVLVPHFAQGHMIPMLDMAVLLANHGATATIVTTPVNASHIDTFIDHVSKASVPIRFAILRFPSSEAGLPEGCENLNTIPSLDLAGNFLDACSMLQEPLVQHLRQDQPSPSCIIADACQPWAKEVSKDLGVPRLSFHGFGCFPLLCRQVILDLKIMKNADLDENETFFLPGLPHPVEITKAQSPWNFKGPAMDKFGEDIVEAEMTADGVVVNSFDDLEPTYAEQYERAIGKKVWMIGPMSLYTARVNNASIDENRCLSWLDSMKPSSVVYVSFGSLANTSVSQVIEIGLGLEASNYPFVWVIRAGEKSSELEEWLSEGYEERIAGRGLILRGWAPQVMILSHPAVGGFMTHCGWNSVVESVCAGVPMITWPHFGEQFLNEKLVVQVMRIGVSLGVKLPTAWGAENTAVSANRDRIEKTVRRLMDEGEEEQEMRERTRELKVKANKAMQEGGASYENMKLLVQQMHSIRHKGA